MEDVETTLAAGTLKTSLCIIFTIEGCVPPEPACDRSLVHKDLHMCLCEKSVLFNQDVVEGLHDP